MDVITVESKAFKELEAKINAIADYVLNKQEADNINEDEIKKILELNLVSERLEHVRDLFLFSCFCGLAYIDVAGLRKEHIRKSLGCRGRILQ